MYINMLGCDHYGYTDNDDKCTSSKGLGWLAALYFVGFVIFGGLVLFSLFIGVICTSMESVQAETVAQRTEDVKSNAMSKILGISQPSIKIFKEIFNVLDRSNQGHLDFDTIHPLLDVLVLDLGPHKCGGKDSAVRKDLAHGTGASSNAEPSQADTGAAGDTEKNIPSFALWELELIFLAVDADLSGVVEFDEFLFFVTFVHKVLHNPMIIHSFRQGLLDALIKYEASQPGRAGPTL